MYDYDFGSTKGFSMRILQSDGTKMASFTGDPVLVKKKIYHSPVITFIDLLFRAHLSCPSLPPHPPPLTPHHRRPQSCVKQLQEQQLEENEPTLA